MKTRILLISFALSGTLISCGASEPNTLFDNAAPESSMMQVYFCDGEKTVEYRLSDLEAETEILELLANTAVTPAEVTTKDVKFPTYSFSIGTQDGWGLNMSWSNGYLYNRDGSVYEFDFNWKRLIDKYGFEECDTFDERSVGLVERYMVLDSDGWNPELMRSFDYPHINVSAKLEASFDGENIHAVYKNTGNDAWTLGKHFSLHVMLGDNWYYVPTDPVSNWATEDIAYEIQPGEERELTYSLKRYGELPAGRYRFAANLLLYEFDVEG